MEFIVNPKILKWARENQGLTIAEAAKKIGAKVEKLEQWEDGVEPLPISKLPKVASVYKRATALFLLDKVPTKVYPIEFRRFFDSAETNPAPSTHMAIRSALRLQKYFKELAGSATNPFITFLTGLNINSDSEELAEKIAEYLKIDYTKVFEYRDIYSQLKMWRELIESQNIGVIETGFDTKDARGFMLFDESFPVIVLNSKDSPTARIFTLMHELAHIVFGKSSIDDLSTLLNYEADDKTETKCNYIAGSILTPSKILKQLIQSDTDIKSALRNQEYANAIELIRSKFKVSKEVITRRLLVTDYIEQNDYDQIIKNIRSSYSKYTAKGNGGDYYRNFIKKTGVNFINLVFTSLEDNRISYHDALEILDVKASTFETLQKRMYSYG